MSERRFQARQGEAWTPERHNQLVKLTEQKTILSGPGVRQQQTPQGTLVSFNGSSASSFASRIFKPSIFRKGTNNWEIRFAAGFIGGVKPTIAGQPIDEKVHGKSPGILVQPEDFDPDEKLAGIWFRVRVDQDFAVQVVEPFAAPSKPEKKPYVVHKLIGFLSQANGVFDRHLFSNLGFYAANRKSNGFFDPLFFWSS